MNAEYYGDATFYDYISVKDGIIYFRVANNNNKSMAIYYYYDHYLMKNDSQIYEFDYSNNEIVYKDEESKKIFGSKMVKK